MADDGISGTQALHRDAFNRMIADCRAGKIDLILTKGISRFARNTVECLSFVRELKSYGVSIYFEKERLDTESAVSEMVLSIMAAVAQEESRNISENLKWGFRKRLAEGYVKWTSTYGYKKVDGEEFVIDPETAPVVQRIFDEYVHGKTLPEIIKGLNEDGIQGARGGDWYPTRLTSILSNERYIGDALCQKTYVTDHITHTKVKNDQTVIPSYYIRNNHEPIVSRKVFYMAREIRSMWDHHIGPIQYPYRGRITCPVCGAKLEREVLRWNKVVPVWHCRPELWEDVQKKVDAVKTDLEVGLYRSKTQTHFLYGIAYCAQCGSPMVRRTYLNRKKENYKGWYCRGRQHRNGCTNPVIHEAVLLEELERVMDWRGIPDAEKVEDRITRYIRRVDVGPEEIEIEFSDSG